MLSLQVLFIKIQYFITYSGYWRIWTMNAIWKWKAGVYYNKLKFVKNELTYNESRYENVTIEQSWCIFLLMKFKHDEMRELFPNFYWSSLSTIFEHNARRLAWKTQKW